MVAVEEGIVLYHVKREEELSGRGECPREYVRGNMSEGNVRIPFRQ